MKRRRNPGPRRVEISITGRRWFQRTYGNTYHSVEISVWKGPGTSVWKTLYVPFEYGYGDTYLQTALDMLQKARLVPKSVRYLGWSAKEKLARRGIYITNRVIDVNRKKDL